MKTWGLDGAEIDKGINGPYVAAVHFTFESMDAMGAAARRRGHRRRHGRHGELHDDRAGHPDQRDRQLSTAVALTLIFGWVPSSRARRALGRAGCHPPRRRPRRGRPRGRRGEAVGLCRRAGGGSSAARRDAGGHVDRLHVRPLGGRSLPHARHPGARADRRDRPASAAARDPRRRRRPEPPRAAARRLGGRGRRRRRADVPEDREGRVGRHSAPRSRSRRPTRSSCWTSSSIAPATSTSTTTRSGRGHVARRDDDLRAHLAHLLPRRPDPGRDRDGGRARRLPGRGTTCTRTCRCC